MMTPQSCLLRPSHWKAVEKEEIDGVMGAGVEVVAAAQAVVVAGAGAGAGVGGQKARGQWGGWGDA